MRTALVSLFPLWASSAGGAPAVGVADVLAGVAAAGFPALSGTGKPPVATKSEAINGSFVYGSRTTGRGNECQRKKRPSTMCVHTASHHPAVRLWALMAGHRLEHAARRRAGTVCLVPLRETRVSPG